MDGCRRVRRPRRHGRMPRSPDTFEDLGRGLELDFIFQSRDLNPYETPAVCPIPSSLTASLHVESAAYDPSDRIAIPLCRIVISLAARVDSPEKQQATMNERRSAILPRPGGTRHSRGLAAI